MNNNDIMSDELKFQILSLIQMGITQHALYNAINFRELSNNLFKEVNCFIKKLEEDNQIVRVKYNTGVITASFLVPKGTEFTFNNVRCCM